MRLHRLDAHEQGGRDLFVRRAARGEVGNLPLCRSQLSAGRAMNACSLELEPGAFAPESRAELLEHRPRLLERLVVACMHFVRVAYRGVRPRQVAQLREDQGATSERGGDPRREVEASCASLEPLRKLLCLGPAAEAEERLDRVRAGSEGDGVPEWFAVGECDQGLEPFECGAEVAQ